MKKPGTYLSYLSSLLLAACSAAPHKVPEDVPAWRKNVSFAEASHVGWQRSTETFGEDFRWRVGDSSLFALTRHNRGDVDSR